MNSQITIREAVTAQEIEFFWQQLHEYHKRDIMPDPEDEDRDYFLDDSQYRAVIEKLHSREVDPVRYLLFQRDGADIGFAMADIFHAEDGKCFLMEFCVFPTYRSGGVGTQCGAAFLAWAGEKGAKYTELNANTEQRRRFWSRIGFRPNGADEWGMPLMLLPPEEKAPFSVEILEDGGDWQLKKLENGYLSAIGEEPMDETRQGQLEKAVNEGKITFFLAKRGCRAVGMCSVVRTFSTFACTDVAIFEDFYVEPVFRKQGIARQLADAAQTWAKEQGCASLTVTCAPCDEKMYQALGFETPLGKNLAFIP